MATVNLSGIAIVNTAFNRPHYLKQVLASWQHARGIGDIHSFTVALGWHEETFKAQLRAIGEFRDATGLGERCRVKIDSSAARRANGMHTAIAQAGNHVLQDPAVEFVVFTEEDLLVSTDVLEYFAWAREAFAGDGRVLYACAHNVGGQGWDRREPAQDADADQEAVRLLPYFNPWTCGTWRDRWVKVVEPSWDYRCDSGGALDSGHDWNLATRVIPRGNYLSAVPDASRSQNIGQHGGWAANPADFHLTQAQSFRPMRDPVAYRLVTAEAEAA